jgi:metalloendopeptidase OMA1, mitochondrial
MQSEGVSRTHPILLPLLTGALLLTGCYTVPQTGRRALNIIPASEEMRLGATSFEEMKQKEKISSEPRWNDQVRRVGERISRTAGADMPSAQWEFVVFDADETVNAFALPGGKVGVYTGLLRLAANDAELAFVMGHEIGHVTAHHGSERMSQSLIAAGIGALLSESLRNNEHRDQWMAAYGAGASLAVLLPYSRLDESEADKIGMIYAAQAGYDPHAALAFWQKMADRAKQKGTTPAFLSTHPADEVRLKRIAQTIPQVLPLYEAHQTR